MSDAKLDRKNLIDEGDTVRADVYMALLAAKNVKIIEEKYNEFVRTALIIYGCVARAQILEAVSQMLTAGVLTEERIDKSISALCHEIDLSAEKLGNQLELIYEVRNAPDVRH